MQVERILQRLFSLHRFGIKPGLDRTLTLLDRVGNPHTDLRCIHVAGTNGKGSVCSTFHSILVEAGYRCGLYTSPHIHRFNERIRFGRECISDEMLCDIYVELEPHIAELEATFFEVTTVMAFLAFERMDMEYVVLETGMGGLYDSTNVVQPCVSVITSIDRDHEEYLGDTLEKICLQKAGIIKKGVPVVVGEQRPALRELLRDVAAENESPFFIAEEHVHVSSGNIDGQLRQTRHISYVDGRQGWDVGSALCGEHQARNLACVLTGLDVMNHNAEVGESAVKAGIERVVENAGLVGRCHVVCERPLIIADVGHNEACIREGVRVISQSPYEGMEFALVYGVMSDKDCAGMLTLLGPLVSTVFAGAPGTERAMHPDTIVRYATEAGVGAQNCGTIEEAVRRALGSGSPLLITGSFYVVDEALEALRKHGVLR